MAICHPRTLTVVGVGERTHRCVGCDEARSPRTTVTSGDRDLRIFEVSVELVVAAASSVQAVRGAA